MDIKECRKETQKHIDNVRNILNKCGIIIQ